MSPCTLTQCYFWLKTFWISVLTWPLKKQTFFYTIYSYIKSLCPHVLLNNVTYITSGVNLLAHIRSYKLQTFFFLFIFFPGGSTASLFCYDMIVFQRWQGACQGHRGWVVTAGRQGQIPSECWTRHPSHASENWPVAGRCNWPRPSPHGERWTHLPWRKAWRNCQSYSLTSFALLCGAIFRRCLFGKFSEDDVKNFWNHIEATCDWWDGHPGAVWPNRSRLTSVGVYGDEVVAYRNSECGQVSVVAWTSELAYLNESMLRYFTIASWSEHRQSEHTYSDCMEHVVNSFEMLAGPKRRWPWSDASYLLSFTFVQGDLKWICEFTQLWQKQLLLALWLRQDWPRRICHTDKFQHWRRPVSSLWFFGCRHGTRPLCAVPAPVGHRACYARHVP